MSLSSARGYCDANTPLFGFNWQQHQHDSNHLIRHDRVNTNFLAKKYEYPWYYERIHDDQVGGATRERLAGLCYSQY